MEEVLRLEELVEEILIRLPPDDPQASSAPPPCAGGGAASSPIPASAAGSSGTTARPRCSASSPTSETAAASKYDPYDDELYGQEYDFVARFVPTTPFRPIFPDIADHRDRWNAAVLCGHHGACDHCDCNLGPFAVVLLDSDTEMMRVHIYLSEIEAWSEPSYGPPSPIDGVEELPTALVWNAFYFLICASHSILEFDLATWNMSVIPLLPEDDDVEFTVLVTMGDGHLGFARIHDSRLLFIWSMETDPLGHAQWALTAILELEALLPVDAFPILNHFLGFAHGIGVFFVPTQDERSILTIDVSSYQVRREDCGDGRTHGVVPYTGFYTPGANFLSS
ncbi:hypothetical protein HU200_061494 [Digitaria exilis]|uniref:Uncharacterized protein n=1 Tax=Digitaria exilis TaxID=1010633 RepID=A0A835AH91_9POAL|nr:hypothetical protein HU200_061494 [Digitaria exilis]